ncbi:MAG TPA: questin oxidase family protein [Candidatus Binataceae bacterium]
MSPSTMSRDDYRALDVALTMLAPFGPEFRGGLSNHGPMAVEAMCALGRADAVIPWTERYLVELEDYPAHRERIVEEDWQLALGDVNRHSDWAAFFKNELEEHPWSEVLERWAPRLAPGVVGAATHGVIRAGHAVRSIAIAETPARRAELAEGLGYWAATYQKLSAANRAMARELPSRAIARVAMLPRERRSSGFGTIVAALGALDAFEPFATTLAMVDDGADPGAFLSDLSETFARVYLANARNFTTTIAFIHCVTGPAALRPILPYLGSDAAHLAVRYGWQAAAAIYATFGKRATPDSPPEPVAESVGELIARALACGDEHAIKFTEVCIRERELNPKPIYLAAARHAIGMLGGREN